MRLTPFRFVLIGTGLAIQPSQGPHSSRPLQAPSRIRVILEPRPATVDPATLAQLAQVLQRRLVVFRAASAESSGGRVVVLASGVTDLQQLEELLTESGVLELHITDAQNRFRDALTGIDRMLGGGSSSVRAAPVPGEYLVEEDRSAFVDSVLGLPTVRAAIPAGIEIRWGAEPISRGGQQFRPFFALDSHPILTDRGIKKASARRDMSSKHSVVVFSLTTVASQSFCRETGRHIHDYLAIVLNDRVRGMPPIITDQICGGVGQIDLQNAPLADARTMADVMSGGALPVPVVVIEENVLGTDHATWSPGVLVLVAVLGVLWLVGLFLLSRRRGRSPPLGGL